MTTSSTTKNRLVRSHGMKVHVFTHECQKCDKWGSFGYDVDLQNKKSGEFYCSEHRPIRQESLF